MVELIVIIEYGIAHFLCTMHVFKVYPHP